MDTQVILIFIAFTFALLGVTAVPYLKSKGLWVVALFAVNIIEQICDFMELNGYGKKKYAFVEKVLLMMNPKLTADEIEVIIEQLVEEMKNLK